jgi:hypothetical protein
MRTAFPSSDYYGGSVPLRDSRSTTGLAASALEVRADGRPRSGSHVHHGPIGGGGAQLFPGSMATPTPQTFGVTPDDGHNNRRRARFVDQILGAYCNPAHIHQI